MADADSLQDHLMETLGFLRNEVQIKVEIAAGLAELSDDGSILVEMLRERVASGKISGKSFAEEARRLMGTLPVFQVENLIEAAEERGQARGAAWAVSEIAKSIAGWRREHGCEDKH